MYIVYCILSSSAILSCCQGGKYYPKSELVLPDNLHKRWTDVQNLSIEHCLEPWRDVAKGTYNVQIIRRAFSYAHQQLGIQKLLLTFISAPYLAHFFFIAEGLRREKKNGILHLIVNG